MWIIQQIWDTHAEMQSPPVLKWNSSSAHNKTVGSLRFYPFGVSRKTSTLLETLHFEAKMSQPQEGNTRVVPQIQTFAVAFVTNLAYIPTQAGVVSGVLSLRQCHV